MALELIQGKQIATASWALRAVTASYALTASYLEGYISPFPFTGSAQITGSLGVTGSVNVSRGITGSLFGTSSWATNFNETDPIFTAKSGSFATTGSNTFVGTQTITGSNGRLIYKGTTPVYPYTLAEIHANDDYPWLERFYNDTFSTSSAVMAYYGHNDGRFVFHNESTQSIGLQVNGFGAESGLLVYEDKVAFVNNVEVTGSLLVSGAITGSLFGTSSWASDAISSSFAINAATASNILGGKAPHIPYFITDTTLATSSIYQSGSTSVIINQDNNTTDNPEALYVWQPHPTSINVISGKGNLNNYLQLNIQNTNQGTAASSDIVATADNGNETTNYIDMGINSENYTGVLGGANDAYVYSTGNHLHIGNATAGQYVGFFAGGDDVDANMKLVLDPFNNHQITGSLEISGSIKAFSFTGSLQGNAATATTAGNGGVTQLLAGPNITLGPTNGLGQVTISSTGGGGGGGFNTATGSYGSFYSTSSQANPVANTPRSMSLDYTDITNGVSVSGSTNPFNTYIKTENAGVYNIQFSAQVDKTDSGTDEILIWLRKNGIDLTDTATTITLNGNNDKQVAAWNWFVNSAANDYYQIIWLSADTDMRLLAEPISGTHPGIPSVIVTANRVDQFLSNTGSFSGTFTGDLTGTASFATTSSYTQNAQSASYALTASYALSSITSSYAITAGTAINAQSASNFVVASTLTLGATLTDYASINSTIVGTNNLYTQATGSYTSTFVKYTVSKGTNARAGEFVTNWNGTEVTYYDNSTTDIGDTSDITFSSAIITGQIQINANAATSGWKIKTLATFI